MNRLFWLRLNGVFAFWLIVSAAAPFDEASRLYKNGEFLKAASLAETMDTASSLALAARATLAHAIYITPPSRRAVEVRRGEILARKALAITPNDVEANLQLVIALQQKASEATLINAYVKGYASEAYSHLETALKEAPNDPWANALLGGWHFEIVHLAGTVASRYLFKASLREGRAAFTKALALMPGSIILQYEFARALLLSNADKNRTEAMLLLTAALTETPTNYLDKIIAARARSVLDTIKSGSSLDTSRILY